MASTKCATCTGSGHVADISALSLIPCTECGTTGCNHAESVKTLGHCSVCEQDDNCRLCIAQRQVRPPKPTEDETFDPDAMEEPASG